ncbi:LOW QUALITY PROTEIN: uncharacterized protein Dana_GF26370, partial [Drosophila ananassae]
MIESVHFECSSNKTATNVIFKHKPRPMPMPRPCNIQPTTTATSNQAINLLPHCLGGTNYPKDPKQIFSHIFTWCSKRGVGPQNKPSSLSA